MNNSVVGTEGNISINHVQALLEVGPFSIAHTQANAFKVWKISTKLDIAVFCLFWRLEV